MNTIIIELMDGNRVEIEADTPLQGVCNYLARREHSMVDILRANFKNRKECMQ